jgi:signal peptidase I
MATEGTEIRSSDADPARRRRRRRRRRMPRSYWIELPVLLAIALALSFLVKTFVVQPFTIPSASMENTLQGGAPNNAPGTTPGHPFDRILVNKFVYRFHDPRREDVVVFKRPTEWPSETSATKRNPVIAALHHLATAVGVEPSSGTTYLVKRVIGVPGDQVVCCNAQHQITVNGKALNEPYIDLEGFPPAAAYRPFNVTVPKGDLWVMGDHRNDSSDSRDNGPIPISDVIGRVIAVIWPHADWKTL